MTGQSSFEAVFAPKHTRPGRWANADGCVFGKRKAGERDVMWLGVWEYNRGTAFYEKNGFRVVGKQFSSSAMTRKLTC